MTSSQFGQSSDVVEQLAHVRRRALALKADDTIIGMLDSIATALDQVLAEHEGMADELISTYEQLGIVFEVTHKLPTVRNESEVLSLFYRSLQRTFSKYTVFAGSRSSSAPLTLLDHAATPEAWVMKAFHRAIAAQKTSVEPLDAPSPAGDVEVMMAPVRSSEHNSGIILITRTADAPEFRACDMMIVESLANFCGDLIRNHRLVRQMRDMSVQMVRSLVNAVDQKDEYTSGHSLRVAYYATRLGAELKLRDVELQMLQWSALLHDVGKIGIRDDVLKKEGRLTDAEFDHIKEHPMRSHSVVQAVPQLADALAGILHHHEHYNGKGYPYGLSGEDIPLQARIIQIGDVFDALTSNRSYRKAFSWRDALDILRNEAGQTVDPKLQQAFDAMIRRELEHDEAAWERMVAEACAFEQKFEGQDSAEQEYTP